MSTVFIGLMSGTSLDGIDGVVVDVHAGHAGSPHVLGHAHRPFAPALRAEVAALNRASDNEVHRGAIAANALARLAAEVVEALLHGAGVERTGIVAIGSHGQTIRHRPGEFDGIGYTTQINAPALLAELTGIDVVADFRSRDVAAGGQGAPLVPAFHRAVFARPGTAAAVLNLGGIANLTSIDATGSTIGFDIGPASNLLDRWCESVTGRPYDAAGAWAASGRVDGRLLDVLLAEPYFALAPPKSTGRDLFDAGWLQARLAQAAAIGRLAEQDIQATLAELTARTCADAFLRHAADASELVVCGGGAFNLDLLARLSARIAPKTAVSSAARGWPPEQVEAAAFAWLAHAFTRREPGNIAGVTGARGPRVLGALYPAG